jgi:hypothetical protein
MARRLEVTREWAESVAIQALSFMAEDPERLDRFMALTGIESQSLRDAAREPNFLLGVLDHVAGDERLLRDFTTQRELEPEFVIRARDLLAGARPATP